MVFLKHSSLCTQQFLATFPVVLPPGNTCFTAVILPPPLPHSCPHFQYIYTVNIVLGRRDILTKKFAALLQTMLQTVKTVSAILIQDTFFLWISASPLHGPLTVSSVCALKAQFVHRPSFGNGSNTHNTTFLFTENKFNLGLEQNLQFS